jgi:uncharacterized protein with HEPN domain
MLFYAEQAIRISDRHTYDSWVKSDEGIFALQHVIQNIGEAANRTSDELRQEHSEIPWRDMIGMRHIIVHHYEDLDLDEVWQAATIHASALITSLRAFLSPLPPEESDDLNP